MPDHGSPSWPSAVAGVVLAGGRSRRMGRDKALVEYRGRPLIAIATSILERAGCPEILISGRSNYGLAVSAIPDELSDAGPLGGLSSVLNALASEASPFAAIVAIPVDCPNLRAETLARLARQPGAAICTTRTRAHPTVGRWPIEIRAKLDQYLTAGSRAFVEFADLVEAARIEIDDTIQLHNINTPDDLAD